MKITTFKWTARTAAVLILAGGVSALAQSSVPKEFRGVFNAYTPQTPAAATTPPAPPANPSGPYEVRGPWKLVFKDNMRRADFTAELNMEFSDGWVLSQAKPNFDPTTRNAHTHHITLDGDVMRTATGGFQITGTANFTLNGGAAPPTVAPSQVVIVISGGADVEYSNITLTFLTPGSNHFGTAPLPGVIVRTITEHRR
jgi:hypothetical protein